MTFAHPTTLIIGDLHHKTELADQAIRQFAGRYEQIVFLGDFLDCFGDNRGRMRTTCQWLKASLAQSNRLHLLGNHDLAYLFPRHRQCTCPGHTPGKQRVFDEEMAGLGPKDFRVAIQVGSWLLSHAGFTSSFAQKLSASEVVAKAELEFARIIAGQDSDILHVGPSRGGADRTGGLFWLDWPQEFRPISGLNQIVGHSPAKGVLRAKCLTAAGMHRQFELCEPSPWPRMTQLPQPGPDWTSVNWCLDTGGVFAGLLKADRFDPLIAETRTPHPGSG